MQTKVRFFSIFTGNDQLAPQMGLLLKPIHNLSIMIRSIRENYNSAFRSEKYAELQKYIEMEAGQPCLFRIAETPIFVPREFKQKLIRACDDAFNTIMQADFRSKTNGSLTHAVPNETPHTHFMQVDFGVCADENGELTPQMIEIQGFPSLYFYQTILGNAYRKHFQIPAGFSTTFDGLSTEEYLTELRKVIVGNHHPKNVVLLEIEPEKQGTNIDFYATEKYLGIKILCLTKLKKSGRDLFYLDKLGQKVPVYRIYNRVIFDELDKKDELSAEFKFSDEVNVEWAGHPNWFFRISKYTLPLIRSPFVPKSYFLNELVQIPDDLQNYVLKPLFSFAGMGVKINVNKADLEAIKDPENYILQRKVEYAPVVQTPDVSAKCEIRMMAIWKDGDARPRIVNNIGRLSKGEMIGVRYNKDKEWVGSSICFFEP